MTQIITTSDHDGPVRYSYPPVRFPESHQLSVDHDRAVELVEAHDEVELVRGIPTSYPDLQQLGAALPTDEVKGNDSANEIVAFLEKFSDDKLEVLKRHPGALEEGTDAHHRPTFDVDLDHEPDPSEASESDAEAEEVPDGG